MPQSGELEGSCFSWFLDCIIHAFNRPAANTTPPLLSVDGPIDRGCLERGKRTVLVCRWAMCGGSCVWWKQVSYEVGMFLLRTLDASRGIRQFTDLQLSRAFRLFSGTRAALTQVKSAGDVCSRVAIVSLDLQACVWRSIRSDLRFYVRARHQYDFQLLVAG